MRYSGTLKVWALKQRKDTEDTGQLAGQKVNLLFGGMEADTVGQEGFIILQRITVHKDYR